MMAYDPDCPPAHDPHRTEIPQSTPQPTSDTGRGMSTRRQGLASFTHDSAVRDRAQVICGGGAGRVRRRRGLTRFYTPIGSVSGGFRGARAGPPMSRSTREFVDDPARLGPPVGVTDAQRRPGDEGESLARGSAWQRRLRVMGWRWRVLTVLVGRNGVLRPS
jgi:hypothetical protein